MFTRRESRLSWLGTVAYRGILLEGSKISFEDRGQTERGYEDGRPLIRGFGCSCNLVQEILFHIVKFLNFWYFKTLYDDNQFVIANAKQLRT